MNEKVLTISVAAYNVEAYLERTLDSLIVRKDVLNKLEIFVINDGSHDRTKEIAETYASRYADSIFVITKENGGWGSTVNCSIANAHGKYFRILDGDDWYLSENIEDYITFLEKTEADIVLAPYIRFYENSKTSEFMSRHSFLPETLLHIAELPKTQLTGIHMHEMAVKTKLLREQGIRITEHCFYADEEYVFLPVMFAKTITKFNKAVYGYRIGAVGQSISVKSRKKNWRDGGVVARKLIAEWKAHEKYISEGVHYSLENELIGLLTFQYETLLIANTSDAVKKELKEFDWLIKEQLPELYKRLEQRRKNIWLLHLSRLRLYKILHIYTMCKFSFR